ncbi:MAG: LPXTG cell wall anchor domain-containing protein, partial [Oscillospiraceae bacterium]
TASYIVTVAKKALTLQEENKSMTKGGAVPSFGYKENAPKTGDTSNTMLYLGLIVLSGCVAGFGLKKKKYLSK